MNRVPPRTRVGLIGALALAAVVALAAPGTAHAATGAGPSASLAFAAGSVSSGTQPAVTFVTADLPTGSDIYLQRESGTGQWQSIGRTSAEAGTVRLPAEPAAQYWYRILVARGGATIVTSAPAGLTVTGAQGTAPSSSGCSSCDAAGAVLPWLVPIIEPVIAPLIQQAGSALLSILGALLGF